jgi:small-conductance mechanosensitive channel
MKLLNSLAILGLLLLVLAGVIGLVLTRDSGRPASSTQTPGHRAPPVGEQPLQTARNMAKLVSSWDEQRIAQQALKLADHEVDLAFADALRDATEQPRATSAQSRELYARESKAEALVQADQSRVDDLKKKLAAPGSDHQKNSLQQQLDIVQAQMELDQDELDDAKEDLSRSGLDPLSRVQRQFNRYEAAQQADTTRPQFSPGGGAPSYATGNLISRIAAWRAAHNQIAQLLDAHSEAARNAAALSQKHDELEKQVAAEQSDQQALAQEASAQLASEQTQNSAGASGETAAALFSFHTVSVDQKDLADLDRRVQDHTELRDAYGNWIALVKSDQRAALHGILKSALLIVLIVLAMYLLGLLVEHFLSDLQPEHARFRTLRIIVRFALRAVGFVLILLVIFGVPNQITTVLGLAGAGLTVALQDFIISFLGWFALMGRNGIRVGDWVEINGVAGEVMEIGLLRTVLLETGNWAEAGHPTGRKVAMMNSYAIQGHFFNFSTSGQWLWDEVQVTVPATEDPYPIIEAIQQMVVKETEADTSAAEKEWKQATSRYRVHAVSADPAVNLRPTGAGTEVHVRYITRANERYATRTRLYQAVVELLHRRGVQAETAQTVPAQSAKS